MAPMRPYELMIICTGDLDDAGFSKQADWLEGQLNDAGADVTKIDRWGRRRFAYEIDHKLEGYYAVYELLAEGGALDSVERNIRLSDEFIRHKLIRLPDHEAKKRGMFGGGPVETTSSAPVDDAPADEDVADEPAEEAEEVVTPDEADAEDATDAASASA